jgi:glycosyltransferase involved in cell wall biosynthesis
MKFTIITPTLNSEKYIENCLSSVSLQKDIFVEHIVVDGGSTDATKEVVKKFPNVKFIHLNGSSIYEALNHGINFSTGDFIAFLNSDDYYEDEFVLKRVLQFFIKNSVDIVYCDCIMVDLSGRYLYKYVSVNNLNFKIASKLIFILPHPSTFFRKSVFDFIGLYDTFFKFSSDCEFILRCLMSGIKFKKFNITAARFRRHNSNASSNPSAINDIKTIFQKYNPALPFFYHRFLFLVYSVSNFKYLKFLIIRNFKSFLKIDS